MTPRWRPAMSGVLLSSALLAMSAGPAAAQTHAPDSGGFPQGVASGDVTSDSAVIWARGDERARVRVQYGTQADLSDSRAARTARRATEESDFTTQVRLSGLEPDTTYHYRVSLTSTRDAGQTVRSPIGSFRTAPGRETSRAVSFTVGGDVGGQRYCRRPDRGYDIFDRMSELEPDFFVANGDMIYADGECPAEGPDGPGPWENVPGDFPSIASPTVDWTDRLAVQDNYRKHWRYHRADRATQAFLRHTPMYSQWDDHEVINDFGGPWTWWNPATRERPGYRNLLEEGTEAFFDWNPIRRNRAEENRIYRSFSWGEDADLFILDQRSYRSRNDVADTPENAKTLLGPEQLEWIKSGLSGSEATWKVVSQDVPWSILTGSIANGRDGWANGGTDQGFEREGLELLRHLDEQDVDNLAFVVTDVHNTQNIRYSLDADGDGDQLVFHEFVTGPLSAVMVPPGDLDPSFNPTRLYGEGNLFNFGHYRIGEAADGQVHFRAEVRGEDGTVRPGSEVDIAPR